MDCVARVLVLDPGVVVLTDGDAHDDSDEQGDHCHNNGGYRETKHSFSFLDGY